jgi:DNA-binding MarR family transcriptional regulator
LNKGKVAHKNQTDRGLVLGYYLEHMTGQPSFTTSELGELGIQTRQPFSNISDIVSRLVSRGLMMSSGDKEGQRAYSLTASGEEYVESTIDTKA